MDHRSIRDMARVPRCPACDDCGFLLDYSRHGLAFCRSCRIWSELDRLTTAIYDAEYVATRYERYETTKPMSDLRRRVLETTIHLHETIPAGKHVVCQRGRLLDVGYGDGSFIRRALGCGWDAFGFDVNPTEYDGVRRIEQLPLLPLDEDPAQRYRVITFFDSLEHFEDLRWASYLATNAEWIMVSVPRAPEGFPTVPWKHRRRGEHHFHFRSARSFETIFSGPATRAVLRYAGNPEDVLRGTLPDGQPNILTCVLQIIPRGQPVVE